jgi:branched-chain amino acid transport system ATP-binding protein
VPDPALAIDELTVTYGPVAAVRALTLDVGAGEVVGLIGPNGAGKTTTLLAVMVVLGPRSGDVRLNGRSLVGRGPEDVVRAGVSLVPEGRHVFPSLTVEENLRLGLVGRRTRDGAAQDLEEVRTLFPVVREFAQRQAGVLSGGQQQMLVIARALLARPDVLLLDEPSLGLAPSVVDQVFGALTEIRRRGVSILLVEQRAQLTVGFCDRTYVLNGGEVRTAMTPGDADDTARMVAAYFGA